MNPSVINVTPKADYVLLVEFDNGESGELDMKPYLDFGVFKNLEDSRFFQQVRVSFDTIAWGNEIDLDPEFVYEKCRINHPAQSV